MSNDLNSVSLIGRLTSDMEVTYSKTSNMPIGKFSLAVNRSVKRGEQWTDEVSYIPVTLMGKRADSLKPMLVKGKQICVTGSIIQSRWEKDGKKNSFVYVMADNIQLLGGGNNSGNSKPNPENNVSGQNPGYDSYAAPEDTTGEFSEDIPF